jgi:radical SAM superfamily enzyme YgiQ (UPF0313 family)
MKEEMVKKSPEVILVFPRTGSMDVKGILVEIPQGLLFIAAHLVKEGFSVRIIDQRIDENWKEILRKEAVNAKFVGISAMTGKQISYGLEIARFVRKISKAKIIWGGIHPTIMPEQTIRNNLVDIVCVGEGEEVMVNLLKKKDWKKIRGIYFRENGKVIKTEPQDFMNLNKTPPLPFHLFRINNYFIPFVGTKALHLHTSRGCPYRCAFCYNRIFNKSTWRAMDAKMVADLVEYVVKKFRINGIVFADDNFFVNVKRVEDIFKELDKRNIHIRWKANCRIDTLDRMGEDFISFLENHGLDTLDIGIESGSDKTLNQIEKDITAEQIYRVNKRLAKRKIRLRYGLMIGMPNENEEDREETLKMTLRLTEDNKNALIANISIFSPYPGCRMFDDVVKMGYSPPKNLESWADFNYTTTDLPFIDKKLQKKLENISHMSRFVDERSTKRYLVKRPLMWVVAQVYSKIVRRRWKKRYFSFMPELEIFKFAFNKGLIR